MIPEEVAWAFIMVFLRELPPRKGRAVAWKPRNANKAKASKREVD